MNYFPICDSEMVSNNSCLHGLLCFGIKVNRYTYQNKPHKPEYSCYKCICVDVLRIVVQHFKNSSHVWQHVL